MTSDLEAVRNANVGRVAQDAVTRIVLGAGGMLTGRVLIGSRPESDASIPMPDPLMGALAARRLGRFARREESGHIRYARQEGRTWQEIAAALGCEPDPEWGATAASTLFRDFTTNEHPVFGWTCPSCRKHVADHGPDSGSNPADAEHGHADGCRRLAEAVAEYERQWADDE
jgi:hypothetical protein